VEILDVEQWSTNLTKHHTTAASQVNAQHRPYIPNRERQRKWANEAQGQASQCSTSYSTRYSTYIHTYIHTHTILAKSRVEQRKQSKEGSRQATPSPSLSPSPSPRVARPSESTIHHPPVLHQPKPSLLARVRRRPTDRVWPRFPRLPWPRTGITHPQAQQQREEPLTQP
jgi:hypothetical protein